MRREMSGKDLGGLSLLEEPDVVVIVALEEEIVAFPLQGLEEMAHGGVGIDKLLSVWSRTRASVKRMNQDLILLQRTDCI